MMTATMERPPTETIPQQPEEELVSVVFKLCSLTSHCLQITLSMAVTKSVHIIPWNVAVKLRL